MSKRQLITFDWALKRLLRSKANHEVLEGFLSELIRDDIVILEILESESNKASRQDKFNRVDLKVRNHKGEILLIEVQYEREFDYLQRILFASAKAITEHLAEPESYGNVVKVISVNILFFDLGHGQDYVYHGKTHFRGIHQHDNLELNDKQQALFGKRYPHEIFPEYYLLMVRKFDDMAKDTLDEWIYFLKNEEIKEEFHAKGLRKAKEVLDIMNLPEDERQSYEHHVEDLRYQASMFESTFVVGRMEGRAEGRAEGKAAGQVEERIALAKVMKKAGEPMEKIMEYTRLTPDEIEKV